MMKAEKTIKCRILEPNKDKLNALEKEYEKVQQYINREDVDIYSATVQAMDKYIDWDHLKNDKEYPWHLRNDTFSVEKAEKTTEFDYWAKIPVKGCVWWSDSTSKTTRRNKRNIQYQRFKDC